VISEWNLYDEITLTWDNSKVNELDFTTAYSQGTELFGLSKSGEPMASSTISFGHMCSDKHLNDDVTQLSLTMTQEIMQGRVRISYEQCE